MKVGGVVCSQATKGAIEDFVGVNIENFPSKGMSDVFRDADDTTETFFGVRREARFNSLVVDLLPEVVTKKNANVNGNAK